MHYKKLVLIIFISFFLTNNGFAEIDLESIQHKVENLQQKQPINKRFLPKQDEKITKKATTMRLHVKQKLEDKNLKSQVSAMVKKYRKSMSDPEKTKDISIIVQDETSNVLSKSPSKEELDRHFPPKKDEALHKKKYFLFVSSSMPVQTIRNYLADTAQKHKDVQIIMQGFINNKLSHSEIWYLKVRRKDLRCRSNCEYFGSEIHVRPKEFLDYQVDRVPALARIGGEKVVFGDMSLSYLKSKI